METVSVFLVEKFFPPRCPKCEHAFASPSDFVEYGGGSGSSFVDAKIRQAKAFPELFGSVEEGHEGVISFTNKFDVDFILCQHCHNVTLRIEYASRQVMSRDEAVRLVATQGFTCWREGVAAGNMTRPYSRLSMLGTADLNALTSHVLRAKERVTHYAEERDKADAFATS